MPAKSHTPKRAFTVVVLTGAQFDSLCEAIERDALEQVRLALGALAEGELKVAGRQAMRRAQMCIDLRLSSIGEQHG